MCARDMIAWVMDDVIAAWDGMGWDGGAMKRAYQARNGTVGCRMRRTHIIYKYLISPHPCLPL